MTMMRLHFETDNAAFWGDLLTEETARILHEIADRVFEGRDSGIVRDINGNKVGSWSLDDGSFTSE